MTFEIFAWLLAPLIPALIALYFLKLKRQEVLVSSTFLWRKSLEDLHVNSPFQRLRRSLLLLLQLLILIALLLAASRPIISGLAEQGATLVILIDNSASMNVEEAEGTRLEMARRAALGFVDGMREGDRASVISFSSRSNLVQPLTGDQAKLRAAIGSIKATSCPTDFHSALTTAASIAESAIDASVYVLSDGGFEALSKVAPELERLRLQFVPIGSDRDNVGIVELDVNRDFTGEQRAEIFVSVVNAGKEPRSVTVNLFHGDQLLDVAVLEIEPGKTAPHVFDGSAHAGRVLRVELDRGGALADDDRGWVRVDPPRPVNLLLVDGDWFLERVIRVRPLFEARRVPYTTYLAMAEEGRLADDPADVIVFNGRAPEAPPDRPALYIGCYPAVPELLEGDAAPGAAEGAAGGGDEAGGAGGGDGAPGAGKRPARVENPVIVDQDNAHPVNQYINFAVDLLIAESFVFQPSSLYRSLVDADQGSIAGTLVLTPAGRPALSVVILGFHIRDTNWPWLPSFPMFFSNAIAWLGATGGAEAVGRYRSGTPLVARPPPGAAELVIRDPAGDVREVELNRSGEVSFAETVRTGVYELLAGGEVLERFPVSLLDHGESRLTPGKEIRVGSGAASEATVAPETRDLWKWFALAALAVVLLEWWVYNRRMTI